MELELEQNPFILGGEYFIYDKVLKKELNIQIDEILSEDEVIFKFIDSDIEQFLYRELNDFELINTIDESKAMKLNNENVFSIKTNEIKAILGRKEILEYSKNNFLDLEINKDTVLISITDPKTNILEENILNNFKDSLSIQFYDITKDMDDGYKTTSKWEYVPINNEEAKIILDFILKHKNDNFLIHCEQGKSRSAGVGLAIECILKFNGDKKEFSYESSSIFDHHRYDPNMLVFNTILNEYNKI